MKKEIILSMSPLTSLSVLPDWIFLLIMSVYAFFAPMFAQLLFLLLFVVIDMISGIMLAKKSDLPFSWRKFFMTFTKIISYTLITMTGYIFDYIFIEGAFGKAFMFDIFMLLLCLNEFRSIINNFSKILGYDIWRLVLKAFNKKTDIE